MWGKDVAIIALLLIDKWVKGFSYKFPKISERNQLWAGKKPRAIHNQNKVYEWNLSAPSAAAGAPWGVPGVACGKRGCQVFITKLPLRGIHCSGVVDW